MIKQKVILFDIDNTIFNTPNLKNRLYKKIKNYIFDKKINYSDKKLSDIYSQSTKEIGYFKPRYFIKKINEAMGINLPDNLLDKNVKADELFRDLYSDTKEILTKLSKNKDLLIGIFSGGDNKFQKSKIDLLMHLLSKRHIHIFLDKSIELSKIINKYKQNKLFIVDDWVKILHEAKKIDSNTVTVLIKRDNNEFKSSNGFRFKPDYKITNLHEIINIIQEN